MTKTKRSRRPAALRKLGVTARVLYIFGGLLALPIVVLYTPSLIFRWPVELFDPTPFITLSLGAWAISLAQWRSPFAPMWTKDWMEVVFGTIAIFTTAWWLLLTVPGQVLFGYPMEGSGIHAWWHVPAKTIAFAFAYVLLSLPIAPFVNFETKTKGLTKLGQRLHLGQWAVHMARVYVFIVCVVAVLVLGSGEGLVPAMFATVLPVSLIFLPAWVLSIVEYIREHPEYRFFGILGRGGAARFGGMFAFVRFDRMRGSRRRARAPIYMGKTLRKDDPKLGCRDIELDSDSMMMTVAMTGGGKSLYAATNTLLKWPGGAFVLDPKGEHAQRTRLQRQREVPGNPYRYTTESHVLDVSGTLVSQGAIRPEEAATFNPFEEVRPTEPHAITALNLIAEACYIPEGVEQSNSKHFREGAHSILVGLMAHVVSAMDPRYHNLPAIYDTFLNGHPDNAAADPLAMHDLVTEMGKNEAFGKAPQHAAKLLHEAGENEGGSYLTTLGTGLKWASNANIRPTLLSSSFKMTDIKKKRATVYAAPSFEDLRNDDYRRYMRLLASFAIFACRGKADHSWKTLIMLDEVDRLGRFSPIESGLQTLRGSDVKLWLFYQDLDQLKATYPERWQSFTSACDMQFFGVNDSFTRQYISEAMGEYVEEWNEGDEDGRRHQDRTRPLRSISDITEEVMKGSGVQYVKPADGSWMRLRLVPFTERFAPKEYGRVLGNPHG